MRHGLAWLLALAMTGAIGQPSKIVRPLVDGLTMSMGLAYPVPRFSWQMESDARGARQSAFQVQVATKRELIDKPDAWDSGKMNGSQPWADYAGKPLQRETVYFWRARLWDQNNAPTAWTEVQKFETCLASDSDWKGAWIGGPSAGGNGYHSQFAETDTTEKWVEIDLGAARTVSGVRLFPARPYNWRRDEPGFGFPRQFSIQVSTDGENYATALGPINDTATVDPWEGRFASRIQARYVRLLAHRLHQPADSKPCLALAEMEILDEQPISTLAKARALDSVEEHGWGLERLTDGSRKSQPIGAQPPLLRREFVLPKKPVWARLYVSYLGYGETYVNGAKLGENVLDPAFTVWEKQAYYSAYDAAPFLREGKNAIGIMLASGWWKKHPRAKLQLNVRYADGKNESIVSDAGWLWSEGPIQFASIYDGEHYNANNAIAGWSEPGLNTSDWRPVITFDEPNIQLLPQTFPPIRAVETLKPKSISQPKVGIFVVDFGQNISGWTRIKARAAKGAEITFKHSELLHADGTVNQQNLRAAKATDVYIASGADEESWEPRFTYHGFRYVQVEGWPGTLTADQIEARVVHTALQPRSTFATSSVLINKIHQNSLWGFRTNWHSIPTDCPQRDERQGWMGDAHMTADMGLYNFVSETAYRKFLRDIAAQQGEDGRVADTVPFIWGTNPGDPMWAVAYCRLAWETYRHTGDERILAEHYDGVKNYLELLIREAKGGLISRSNYGDWVAVEETPKDLVSAAAYYWTADTVRQIAIALDRRDDTARYQKLCADIAAQFHAKYFNAAARAYGNGTQTANALPLALGIVPAEHKAAVLNSLRQDILIKRNGHISTGFIGTPFLLSALTENGMADVAFEMVAKEDYPGWGFMVKNDATTIWELWKLETGPGMNSHNHPAFGLVSGWFFSTILGLRPAESAAGWATVLARPQFVFGLEWAEGSIETARGAVSLRWERKESGFKVELTVPANSEALFEMPKKGKRLTETGRLVWQEGKFEQGRDGVFPVGEDALVLRLKVQSGRYVFEIGD